jgi:transposase
MTMLTTSSEHDLIASLKSEIQQLKEHNSYLNEQLNWFKKQVFGQRSEKIVSLNPEEMFLPGLDLPAVQVKKQQNIPAHLRRTVRKENSNKLSFPEDLPVERTIIDLKDEEKICSGTGQPLVKIGEDVTQKLAHKPGSYYIKEIIRPKYASPKGSEETVIAANLPDSLLPKSKADESLLADILVKKFADHLPLYRQSEMLARDGIMITRQLLSQWVIKCGQALKPLYQEMSRLVLKSQNVFIDEVPVDILSPGKGKTHQAYMWVLVGGKEANPAYRVYHFRRDRCHANAAELLKDYHGILHSDKYGAYETLAIQKQFIWCPCWSHIRRKFIEAESGDPEFRKMILRKIKYLFMFERVAWNRSESERLRIRQEKELPIINELISLVKDKLINGRVLAKSKFKEALGYFCGLIPFVKNYIDHPFARLDNNVGERAVRPLAMGRKNWLFLGSEEGGDAAAVILSLVQTCRSLGINPREYLEDIMGRLMSHNNQKLEELLPDVWMKARISSI